MEFEVEANKQLLWEYTPFNVSNFTETYSNPFDELRAGKDLVRQLAWLIGVLYAVVFLVGTLGNALIAITVACHKSMQNVTNYFIANLAVSDFIMCIFCIPWTVVNSLMNNWIFGDVMCRLVPTIQAISVFVSITSHVVIASDRCCLIMFPLKPRLTRATCAVIIALSWISATTLAIPVTYFSREYDLRNYGYHVVCYEMWPQEVPKKIYEIILLLLGYLIPLIVIIILYGRVSYIITSRVLPGVFTEAQERQDLKKKQKTNRLLIAVVMTFAICWFPMYTIRVITEINPKIISGEYYDLVFIICHWFAMSSTVYNPFVYAWLHEKYRRRLKSVFVAKCLRRSSIYRQHIKDGATAHSQAREYVTIPPKSTRFSSLQNFKGVDAV
ncbi:prolactin-releasing peptide receptor-like [Saccoglossus kowalevskii]|uniref:Prolactin-releasing peptide receptor-like n=1 Tax=Saccoglossus kowalevskii TaxID=10224 RepID=A0ABM0GVI4_SACKO|nr:PREDICTED: prolactin-releasing peptide receptor-like [Saccoglossus kowalevskii]